MSTDAGWVTESLRVGGSTVHARRSTGASGVPIVHVHGFAISGAYLMPTARLLAGRWVNVVPDLPGYGHSERLDHVLDIPALAQALLALLDALGIDRAVLLGNSMGCPVALEMAHAAPERVHRLVLVSPAGGVQNQPLIRALGQLGKDMFRESLRMFPVALPDYVRFGPVNGLRLFHHMTLFPSLDRLVHTPAPTLVVMGVRDPLMPSPARVREVVRLTPEHLTVAVVDRAAHAVNFSHPAELAGTVAAWLDDALIEGAQLPDGVRVFTHNDAGSDPVASPASGCRAPLRGKRRPKAAGESAARQQSGCCARKAPFRLSWRRENRRSVPVPTRRRLTQTLDRHYRRAVLAIRLLLTAAGVALLLWAYVILDNIWNYNDSGTLTYILFALVPAVLGVLCLYLALRGWRRSAKGK